MADPVQKQTVYGVWDPRHNDLVLFPDPAGYLRVLAQDLNYLRFLGDDQLVKITIEPLVTLDTGSQNTAG